MHFKHHITDGDWTDAELKEFEKNEKNYLIYTHFMIEKYIGSQIQELEFLDTIPEKRKVINYYVDEKCVSTGSIEIDSDFEYDKKYEIKELLLFDLLSTRVRT